MKILITGGHLTPALAFIDYLQNQQPQTEVVFAGRLFSQSDTKKPAREKMEVEKRAIKFIPFTGPKLSQTRSLVSQLGLPFALLSAVLRASKIIKKEQPTIFLSFGGYLAVPFALACRSKKIPLVTHEQTRAPGLANRLVAKLADKIAVTWPETKDEFSAHKTIVTGNPLRPEILLNNETPPKWLKKKPTKPILLVTGGSQGSKKINQVVQQALAELTKNWTVIHLSGQSENQNHYPVKKDYYQLEWVSGLELAWIYTHAQLAVARAGANTCLELTLRQIPTLYIPLPFARHDEQQKNAQALVDQGAALILRQTKLNSESLLNKLKTLASDRAKFVKNLEKIKLPNQAAAQLYQLLTVVTNHVT